MSGKKIFLLPDALFKTSDVSIGYLLLRIFIGGVFILHGYEIVFTRLAGFSSYVGKLGIPFSGIMGPVAAFSELLGGILLIFGLLTRIASFFLFCTMAVAVFIAHAADPFSVKELAVAYFFCVFMFMLKGGGKFSGDYAIFQKLNKPM